MENLLMILSKLILLVQPQFQKRQETWPVMQHLDGIPGVGQGFRQKQENQKSIIIISISIPIIRKTLHAMVMVRLMGRM